MPTIPTTAKSGVKSYRDIVSAGLKHTEFPGQVDSDGFTTANHKSMSTRVTPLATTIKQSHKLLIGVQNCFSLPVSRIKCSDFIDNVFANNFKIYCIAETWLNNTILCQNLFPDSYCVFHADRDYLTSSTKHGSGVLIAVSKSFEGVKWRYDLEITDGCVWVEIPVADNYL
jgi:hypothetical protein